MIGDTILHYKILEKLGEGGMGEVYKAQDTKLDRFVALKFLPSQLIATEEDKARFIQEAKTASAMNHPNICTIYSIEENNNQLFISMEFVEGKTLKDKKDSLSEKQILEIGIQIAEGLAAAHEKGIVHRDIKPENIMIRKDGIVQIMDFGLAKLYTSSNVSRLTKAGTTIGTMGYMSPEQIQGLEVDHRSDIFSLGVVLYELLSGETPFKGVHETAIAYEIVNVDSVPLAQINPNISPELDAIVLECLEKDPNERTQSASQISVDLKRYRRELSRQRASRITVARPNISSTAVHPVPTQAMEQSMPKKSLLPWMAAGVLGIGFTIFAILYFMKPPTTEQVVRAFIHSPANTFFSQQSGGNSSGGQIAISPDGRKIAFVATDSLGKPHLYVRLLSSLTALPLPGTEGAYYPFWSPKSDFIGFFMGGKLKKIDASGGPPLSICEAQAGRGGTWGVNDVIVFAPTPISPLFQVPAAGGTPVQVTSLDSSKSESTDRYPWFLPDGKHFLYFVRVNNTNHEDEVRVGSIDESISKVVLNSHSNAIYANGYLLFVREQTLLAQKFDTGNLELSGNAVPVVEQVRFDGNYNHSSFSASQNGILIYEGTLAPALNQMAIINRSGSEITVVEGTQSVQEGAFSPDNSMIAYSSIDQRQHNEDIWVYDIVRKLSIRLSFNPKDETDPIWSPDGKKIIYTSVLGNGGGVFIKNADGTGDEKKLLSYGSNIFATSWTRDGKWICVTDDPHRDILVYSADGQQPPIKFLMTDFVEEEGRFSPDGHWLLYMSNESGQQEVYVRPFPGPGGKWQISPNGIFYRAFWKGDGKEIYYISRDGKMTAVKVNAVGNSFSVGEVETLFDAFSKGVSIMIDASNDGQKFLVVYNPIQSNSEILTMVLHWNDELKK
jgi:serine/threonine protein kinase